MLKLLPILFILVACTNSKLIKPDKAKLGPVNSITISELKDHLYFFASDELGGRVIGNKRVRLSCTLLFFSI